MNKGQILFGLIVGILCFLGLFDVIEYPSYIQVPFVGLFVAIWLFTAGIHAKQMFEKNQMDSFLKSIYAPLVIVVILLDIFFNVFFGSIIFIELPREWLFTHRVKRHYWRWLNVDEDLRVFKTAVVWRNRLNWIDPDHV